MYKPKFCALPEALILRMITCMKKLCECRSIHACINTHRIGVLLCISCNLLDGIDISLNCGPCFLRES